MDLDFKLYKNEKIVNEMSFGNLDKIDLTEINIQKCCILIKRFLNFKYKKITSPEQLSDLLADSAKKFKVMLREYTDSHIDSDYYNKLFGNKGLFNLIKDTLIDKIDHDEFIDAYVQTITYGIFLARLNSTKEINKQDSFKNIPDSMGVVKELFQTIEIPDIPENISFIIDQLIKIVNNIDIKILREKLSLENVENVHDYKDPYVYFYENFLTKYDPIKRKSMGVYYTPLPIVDFIINNLDYILKKNLNKKGFKDNSVVSLDFATGTGTFLVEAFKKVIKETKSELKDKTISEHLLKNFFGFEYLIAPYAIAHMKLSQYIKEEGYKMNEKDHIRVLLSDTLDDTHHKIWENFKELSYEGNYALRVKDKIPVLVIMGNPPYSIHSKNNKQWILKKLELYKENLNEKKINLNDDYIKFIRFAQWKIEKTGKGALGVIVNNSFLSGITHRIMRKKLMESFDEIYIIDLNGKSDKGGDGENVFDIRRLGVCVCFFIKNSIKNKCQVYYFSCKDNNINSRIEKFNFLNNNMIDVLKSKGTLKKINALEPNYYFYSYNDKKEEEYRGYLKLTDIFPLAGCGVKTDRDKLFIDKSFEELDERIKKLLSRDYDEKFKDKYNVNDSSSYKITKRIGEIKYSRDNILNYSYRLFDDRYIYYQQGLTSRPANEVMKYMVDKKNVALVYSRQVAEDNWNHIFIVDKISDICLDSLKTKESNYYIPMKITGKNKNNQNKLVKNSDKYNELFKKYSDYNINLDTYISILNQYNRKSITPENIFFYVYGLLNSNIYKNVYREFLIQDVPRVYFIDSFESFNKISLLGERLARLHLKGSIGKKICLKRKDKNSKSHIGIIKHEIKYERERKRLWINKEEYFENIDPISWEYKIGSFKVLDKWLKDLKGNEFTEELISRFSSIVLTLDESFKIINQIDIILKDKFQ